MKCRECKFFIPYISYPWIGYCSLHGNVTVDTVEGCESLREYTLSELLRALETQGYVYCATCRTTLTDSADLEDHYRRRHAIYSNLIADEELHLEIYAAD